MGKLLLKPAEISEITYTRPVHWTRPGDVLVDTKQSLDFQTGSVLEGAVLEASV